MICTLRGIYFIHLFSYGRAFNVVIRDHDAVKIYGTAKPN